MLLLIQYVNHVNQINQLRRSARVVGDAILTNQNGSIQVLDVLSFERHEPESQSEEEHSQSPNIGFKTYVSVGFNHFWREVGGSATSVHDWVVGIVNGTYAEVTQHRIDVSVEEDVIHLDVSVDDVQLMQSFHSQHHLQEE